MNDTKPTFGDRIHNNPAVVVAVVLGLFSALSSYFIDLGSGIDVNTALGKAFGLFGLSGGAGVIIRGLVDGPATREQKDEVIDDLRAADDYVVAVHEGTVADPDEPYDL